MNLLQSLEALNRSLDQLIAESKGEPNGKVDVTSISFTPPREINKSIAVLGIGLIAMGEDVGMSMAKRVLQQILFNGSPSAKRLVPMAFALLSLSYPDQEILTTLEKYSRYQMISMSINSIIALGLIGSGSLDYKLSKMLDSLFEHYDVGPAFCLDALILTKGLLHLGKGLMTLNPFSYDNQLLFPTGLAAILIIAFCSLDIKHTLLGSKLNQLIYYLTPAVRTRFVVTLDEDTLKPVEIPLGVGQALDTAGQVGKLRLATISSTQNSPIILKDHEKLK
ncbi:26S proteasome non-ATPase regulatory subunit 2-like [Panonychus citri]|uniref:26S proteasome non-ATPase regulatory subunit 2-like n=1 Tax=Panonychus citri TaxID=50023 RepID=UPI0023072DAB|nr:26S proteasome non-ATPase regulatory subunit 2-like [Panonychus citri]